MESLAEVLAHYAGCQSGTCFAADSKGNAYTYGEAWIKTQTLAGRIHSAHAVSKGDKVLVRCEQSVEYLLIYLACNLLGAVFIPVEKNASAQRLREIAADTDCKLCITPGSEPDCPIAVTTYAELFAGEAEPAEFTFNKSDDISEILFTTGTTGKSKGIVLTNAANLAVADNIRYGVSMKNNNVELIPLAMSHSHGLRTFYASLLNGSAVVITNGVMNVKQIFTLMEQYKVTALDLSPSAAEILIKLAKGVFWEKSKNLDYIEIGTAALSEALKDQLVENLPGVHLYNFYGSTESGRTCVLDFSAAKNKKKCIGKPSVNAELVFTDDRRVPVNATPEAPGLLASRGPMNMTCYWNNPELTGEILVNGFVCTNDIGYFDEDGYAYVVGRRDDVINCNGIKISPTEIEDIVITYPAISETALVGKPDPIAGQIPKLYIVVKDPASFNSEDFWSFLSNRLDKTKMPKSFEIIDALPRTYNGKLNRKELERL